MQIWRLIPWADKYGTSPKIVSRRMLSHRRVALGWSDIGDLTQVQPASAGSISQLIRINPGYIGLGNSAAGGRCLWALLREMRLGDLVIITVEGTPWMVMEVASEYVYERDNALVADDLWHRRVAERTAESAKTLWHTHVVAPTWNIRWPLVRMVPQRGTLTLTPR